MDGWLALLRLIINHRMTSLEARLVALEAAHVAFLAEVMPLKRRVTAAKKREFTSRPSVGRKGKKRKGKRKGDDADTTRVPNPKPTG